MKRLEAYRWLPLISLCLVGLVGGAVWRIEVEYHGWAGLTWLKYFHWALPINAGLYFIWLVLFCGIYPIRKRLAFLIGTVAFMFIILEWAQYAIYFHYLAGPTAILYLGDGMEGLASRRMLIYYLYPSVPVFVCLIAYLYGLHLRWWHWVLTPLVVLAAFPVALGVWCGNPFAFGNYNAAVHTFKTGYIIPLLIIGLGIPFIGSMNPRPPAARTPPS